MLPTRVLRRTEVRPYMTYTLIAINVLVFIWELTVPDPLLFKTFYNIAVVPCQIAVEWLMPKTWLDVLRSMFLHGSFLHLFGNMLYLVLFGPSVEEYLGPWRFLGFYWLAGVAAVLAHVGIRSVTGAGLMCHLPPTLGVSGYIPLIGASGAIAGVLGAFLLLYPGAKVRAVLPIFRGFGPVITLASLYVLGYWFAIQLLNGFMSIGPSGARAGGGVAFWAHIGGFVAGLILVFIAMLFKPAPPQRLIED